MKRFISRNFAVPLVVACALFMEQLDGSILAIAIPKISEALHTDPVHLNMAITAYMFSLAVFIPLSGWIADRFGARNVFGAAIVIFVLGSIACGSSGNLWQLVCARVLQGFGGAMMVPVGRLILLRTIPKEKLVDALALMVAPALIGPVLGPPVGGLIVTYASWQWIFFINVPMGIAGFVLAMRLIDNVRGRKGERLDFRGFVLVGLALFGLMFGCETLGRNFLPLPVILGVMGAGAFCFILYLFHMRHLSNPIIDLRPLRYATYRASLTGGSLFRITIGALPFLIPLMLQYGFGLSPALAGLVTLTGAIGAIVMKILAKRLIRALGFRSLLILNTGLNALFFAGFAWLSPKTSLGFLFAFLLLGGVFRSLQFTALNSVAFADIPDRLLTRANTLYNMMQQLTLSLGVALGALALNVTQRWYGSPVLRVEDFYPVFAGLTVVCLLSAISFIHLSRNAGAVMSGHRLPEEETAHKDPA